MNETKEVDAKQKVVVVPPSPAEAQAREAEAQEVVKQEAVATPQPEAEQEVAQPAPISAVPAANQDVDEYGVLWKNRAMEWKRKSEEVAERIPQIIEEKLSKFSQPSQPQYTFEQLEAYKIQNSQDPNIVSWAAGEQRKIEQADNRKMFEQIVGERERTKDAETKRQQSFEYVKNTYPDAFNPNHPMSNGIRQYMSYPEIGNNPQGLILAAKAAYADYMQSQSPVLQQKTQQLKQEVRQLQKNSLVEGGGRKVISTQSPQQVALERAKQTGTMKDATSAIGEILKQRGILQEE